MTLLLFGVLIRTEADLSQVKRVTVGSGNDCHYLPHQLNQAIQEHHTVYLTTGIVYPPIQISHPNTKIIGGLQHCTDRNQFSTASQKSLISGFHNQRPVTIKNTSKVGESSQVIHLSNLRLIDGMAEHGGGMEITGSARVHLSETNIENNVAAQQGGGVFLQGDAIELQLDNSYIQFNHAKHLGGGISCRGKHLIKAQNEQQITQNNAPMADNLLIDQHCYIKFIQPE